MTNPEKFLNTGLLKGFAGETTFQKEARAGFALQASHFENEGNVYHDAWAVDRTGGGQELVMVNEKVFTRVYAGGTLSTERLAALGISKDDVLKVLIAFLHQVGAVTRLAQACDATQPGGWDYHYQVLEDNAQIPFTAGREAISYQGEEVFVHVFVFCPVE